MVKIYTLMAIVGLAMYFLVVAPIQKWNCNRVGMDFAYFINGCVVRKK
jgi:hypothetical protein